MQQPLARPVLTAGSAHDDVHVLGRALAQAGYENSVSRGENPFGLVDQSVLDAVHAFRAAHTVDYEADVPGVPHEQRRNWIGPTLWAAVFDAPEPEAETADEHEPAAA